MLVNQYFKVQMFAFQRLQKEGVIELHRYAVSTGNKVVLVNSTTNFRETFSRKAITFLIISFK